MSESNLCFKLYKISSLKRHKIQILGLCTPGKPNFCHQKQCISRIALFLYVYLSLKCLFLSTLQCAMKTQAAFPFAFIVIYSLKCLSGKKITCSNYLSTTTSMKVKKRERNLQKCDSSSFHDQYKEQFVNFLLQNPNVSFRIFLILHVYFHRVVGCQKYCKSLAY